MLRPGHIAVLASLLLTSPAAAQWTRVTEIPAADVFSIHVRGDTILAGADTCVYVSLDNGATWAASARLDPDVLSVDALWIRNGRIYAGTYGWGVFTSGDLGASWAPLNAGLSGGPAGVMHVIDFELRGDSLFAATDGAGVRVLNLAAPTAWQSFGSVPQSHQAGGIQDLARQGDRLVAVGGGNGQLFWNDPGMADWTPSHLNNSGIEPGLLVLSCHWTGQHWLIGTGAGTYRSASAAGPWTPVGPGLGLTLETRFAQIGRAVIAVIHDPIALVYATLDDMDTFELIESIPTFYYETAISGTTLYGARIDGLWRRTISLVDVPRPPVHGVQLAHAGAHPVRDRAHLRFTLPARGEATLEILDLHGRRVARLIEDTVEAGTQAVAWDCSRETPGIYFARLNTPGTTRTLRIVVLD